MHESTHIEFEVDAKIFVIVAARSSRRESLRTLITTIEPRCCVEMAPSVKDLAFLPSASHLSMVVFDLEFETRESLALIPLLAKRWPDTEVVALYNAVHQAPIAGRHIWPWQQAEKALRRSLHGVAPPAPAKAAPVLAATKASLT
jgi:hypothetical protein